MRIRVDPFWQTADLRDALRLSLKLLPCTPLGNLRGPSIQAFDSFIYAAPPLAPLLFPNLVILGIIALWGLRAVTAS